jgi:hypothetical protein
MLSDDLVAGTPVTITVRKGRKRPCCHITPARPQPARSAKGEKPVPGGGGLGRPPVASLPTARARRGARRAPVGPSSDLPSVTRRADPLADKNILIVACPRPSPPLGLKPLHNEIMQTWHGFLRQTTSSRLHPLPPQGGAPLALRANLLRLQSLTAPAAARGPPSDGVPCSSAGAASDPSALVMPERAACCDVLDPPPIAAEAAIGPPPARMRASSRASGQLRYAPLTSSPPIAREPSQQRPAGGLVGQAAARPAAGLPLLAAKPATEASSPRPAEKTKRHTPCDGVSDPAEG